jgi:hypothetical protein
VSYSKLRYSVGEEEDCPRAKMGRRLAQKGAAPKRKAADERLAAKIKAEQEAA